MKSLALLWIVVASSAFAGRRLIEAPIRWRIDMYGSSTGYTGVAAADRKDSQVSTGGPDGRILTKCASRARIELQNVSSVPQKVKVYMRRGAGFEWWTKDGEDFLIDYPTSLSKISAALGGSDVALGPEFNIPKLGDASDLLTLFIEVACSINSGGNQGPCEISYDTPTSAKTVLGTFTGTPVTNGKLLHDASCSFTLPLRVDVDEDRGALMGTVGLLGNRGGGYNHTSYGEGQFKMNGGRAF